MEKYFKVRVKMMHYCDFIVKAKNETEAHDKPSDDPDCRQLGSFEPEDYATEEVDEITELNEVECLKEAHHRERIAQHRSGAKQLTMQGLPKS